jgi:hypothetical protein
MEVSKQTNLRPPWPKGTSGNLNGRPVGSRTAFSQGYISDFAKVWAEEGLACIRNVAKKNPSAFLGIASKLIPQQVQASVETMLPGNLDLADWALIREIMQGIKAAMPDAADRPAGEVLEYVRDSLMLAREAK